MSVEVAIIIWLAIVIASAAAAAYFAHRWGRDPFGWVLLSAVMGPIALIALAGTRQSDRARGPRAEAGRGQRGGGPIVVACDGSKESTRLGEQAAAISHSGRDVVLLAVLPLEQERAEAAEEARQNAESMTSEVGRILASQGIAYRTEIRYGAPGEAIVAFADGSDASLIVIGRRGSGMTRALLGSVSEHVARNAKTPVVLVS